MLRSPNVISSKVVEMSGLEWAVLTRSVAVAQQVMRTDQQLRGGIISDALVEFGDVMVASARDHLVEARTSPQPRRRIEDAAAALQNAYQAYDRALQRGAPIWVRAQTIRYFNRQYRKSLGNVADTAAGVALLRAYLAEPPLTIRKWLDRVAKPVALERKVTQVAYVGTSKWAPGDAGVRQHLISYFNLERLLLPPDFVRSLPLVWKLTDQGVTARTIHELYEPDKWEALGRMATDEPGPVDVILLASAADVMPVFDPDP
jgi:hypothetical protein